MAPRNLLSRFARDTQANIAPIFALALVPMMAFVGAAVDYSHGNSVKSAMQASLDSTALMLSKEAPTLTAGQLNQKASDYFGALFHHSEVQNVIVTPSYNKTDSTLTVASSGKLNTDFMRVMGISQLNVATSATVKWGTTRLRVALALDNTGSMASAGKMPALKTATKTLLGQLQGIASNPGDVYVSIIPFSKDVNVDPVNRNANWVRWDLWNTANGTCSKSQYTTQSSCTSHNGAWTAKNHNTWNGCVTDRDQNYDTVANPPLANNSATLFAAEQYGYCPLQVMGLSANWTAMNSLVDQMYPNGSTNQTIGLVWASMALSGGGPFTVPPIDPDYQYSKIIILLSDGLNTQDRWYGNGSDVSPQVDARMQIACNNAKAAGITLYTVQVNTDNDPTSTLLKNCASDPSKFFLLTSANQMVTTFQQIGTSLAKLHISQ